MIKHVVNNYAKSLISLNNTDEIKNLENNIVRFANLSNFILLLGGKIKNKQMLSGLMADILSYIYLSHGLIWYNNQYNNSYENITELSLKYLNIEAENKINTVIDNYPIMLKPLLKLTKTINLEDYNELYLDLDTNDIINHLDSMIYYDNNDIVGKLSTLSSLDKNSEEYKKLYQDVISIGEYNIEKELIATNKW